MFFIVMAEIQNLFAFLFSFLKLKEDQRSLQILFFYVSVCEESGHM